MKIFVVLLSLSIFLFFSSTAFAHGPYLNDNLWGVFLSDTEGDDYIVAGVKLKFGSDLGLPGVLSVGYGINNNLRVEGEVSYQINDDEQTIYGSSSLDLVEDVSYLALLVNGYYDFSNKTSLTPFITMGAGGAKPETVGFDITGSDHSAVSYDDMVFVYQLGAGISYEIGHKTVIDFEYRYLSTTDLRFDTVRPEYINHNIIVGAHLSF